MPPLGVGQQEEPASVDAPEFNWEAMCSLEQKQKGFGLPA